MREDSSGTVRLSHEEFTCLVDRHQHQLYVYLAGMLGRTEQAFDLVQETFYEAWQAARRGTSPFLPGAADDEVRRWLFRAGSNNVLSMLRRNRLIRWESFELLGELDASGGARFEDSVVESDALQVALAQLAPQDVACLLLRIVHGFSATETGLILNTSADNVNNRLARAKQRLRAAYAHDGTHPREAKIPR